MSRASVDPSGNDARPAGDAAAPVISIENVSKRYAQFVAVENASFEIRAGEFFSMLGPSGCGKTTMLRMIAGFETVTSGAIRLEGVDVSAVPPYRRNVNTVFQQYALFPHMTVFDNIAFGPRTKGVDKDEVHKRVVRMLEVVRLGDFATRRPSQLSGGQRQRVALARALVNYPSALLLDEPLSALDLKLRQAMQIELKRIQREVGITFVFVTHDQEEALTMSDRIAVMSAGHVEQVGTPEEIYHSPATVFVAGFIGTANLLPATVEKVHEGTATVALAGGRHADVPTSGAAFERGASALVMIRPEQIHLSEAEPADGQAGIPATLTDVIFQGPVVRCVLRAPDETEIVAHIGPEHERTRLRSGSPLWVGFAPGTARLLPSRS